MGNNEITDVNGTLDFYDMDDGEILSAIERGDTTWDKAIFYLSSEYLHDHLAEMVDDKVDMSVASAAVRELIDGMDSYEMFDYLCDWYDQGMTFDCDIKKVTDGIDFSIYCQRSDVILAYGYDPREYLEHLQYDYILEEATLLLTHGVTIKEIYQALCKTGAEEYDYGRRSVSRDFARYLKVFLDRGIEADTLKRFLAPTETARYLDLLTEHHAKIDIDKLVKKLRPSIIVKYLEKLRRHGATIDLAVVVSEMKPLEIVRNLDKLIANGIEIDVEELTSKLTHEQIMYYEMILEKYWD